MKKSLLILLPIISCSVTTAAVAQETLAQVRTSQINSMDTIEAFEQLTIRSIVVSVNNRDRTIVLQGEDGAKYDLNFGRDFKAFDTVKVGDQLTGQLTRKIIIEPNNAASNAIGTINYTVQRSVSGDDIDKSITQVSIFNTEIIRVDVNYYTVTFVNPDGTSRTVAMSNPRLQARFASLEQGQRIRVQIDSTFQIVNTDTTDLNFIKLLMWQD